MSKLRRKPTSMACRAMRISALAHTILIIAIRSPNCLRRAALNLAIKTAHREKNLGIWRSYSWHDYYSRARRIGLGLVSLGLKRGDVVSILSEDNKEWLYTDLGIQCVGGVASGVYTTDSPGQLAYLVNDSDSRFLFVENDEMLDKYLEIKDEVPDLVKVIIFERDGLHDFHDEKTIFLDELYDLGDKLAQS